MNLYNALDFSHRWGSRVWFYGDRVVVTDDTTAMGAIVEVAGLAASGDDAKAELGNADMAEIRNAIKHGGEESTYSFTSTTLTINKPNGGTVIARLRHKATARTPRPSDGLTWVSLPDNAVKAIQAATAVAGEGSPHYALNGVRVTPDYVAASNGIAVVVVWVSTGVKDSVTVPFEAIKRLRLVSGSCSIAVEGSRVFFRSGDLTYWTSALSTPWPDHSVNDMIPKRRDMALNTAFQIPEEFSDAVDAATIWPTSPANPARLTISASKLDMMIPRRMRQSWSIEQEQPSATCVGFDPHVLKTVMGVLPDPAKEPVYMSLGGPTDTLLIYSAGTTAVEALVSPVYLPA